MLADFEDHRAQFGAIGSEVHLPAASRIALLDFIARELPRWRDRADRPAQTSEAALTSQLCAHMNSCARRSTGWDFLQFRVEELDEHRRGRRLDLISAPSGATIWIDGRRFTDFDTLLPIECKRLPTPKGKGRDEREYVFNRRASTGGIQRFKAGHHAGAHSLGAMIAYLQSDSTAVWQQRICGWIRDVIASAQPGWTADDALRQEGEHAANGLAIFRSVHSRDGLPDIELHHFWVEMG